MTTTTKCPNCNELGSVFGSCGSKECLAGLEKLHFCPMCYRDHVAKSHNWFTKILGDVTINTRKISLQDDEKAYTKAKWQVIQAIKQDKIAENQKRAASVRVRNTQEMLEKARERVVMTQRKLKKNHQKRNLENE